MKFLILTQYFSPEIGAPQVRFAAMIPELKKLGHEVEVVTALPNHPTGKIFNNYRGKFYLKENFNGVAVHRVWVFASIGGGLKRLLNYFSFVLTSFYGLSRAERPDILFVESPPLFLSLTAFVYSRLRGIPFVFNVADLWPDTVFELGMISNGWVYHMAHKLELWTYKKAKFVNAVTDGIRESLLKKKHVANEKILFLPNGASSDIFSPDGNPDKKLAEELGLLNKRVVLYAGTIGFAQGLDVVINVAAIIKSDAELNDVVFVLIGDGSDRQRLQNMAEARNLTNVIFLPPNTPQYVAKLFSCAWAGLVCLKSSPLFLGARPSKLMTIMASCKPVIYVGEGEGAQIVNAARSGVTCRPEDPQALLGALRDLQGTEEDFGINGKVFVENHLSWKSVVGNWVRELEARL